jgi:hypothetical protein
MKYLVSRATMEHPSFGDTKLQSRIHLSRFHGGHANLFLLFGRGHRCYAYSRIQDDPTVDYCKC